jgi:hypothetical protein
MVCSLALWSVFMVHNTTFLIRKKTINITFHGRGWAFFHGGGDAFYYVISGFHRHGARNFSLPQKTSN